MVILWPISISYINETSSFNIKKNYIMENFYHKRYNNTYVKILNIDKKYIILIKIIKKNIYIRLTNNYRNIIFIFI